MGEFSVASTRSDTPHPSTSQIRSSLCNVKLPPARSRLMVGSLTPSRPASSRYEMPCALRRAFTPWTSAADRFILLLGFWYHLVIPTVAGEPQDAQQLARRSGYTQAGTPWRSQ